jgi:hypothetical protein
LGQTLHTRHGGLLENSPQRLACQFETERSPLEPLRRLSRSWPRLTFLLSYEEETKRIMGLAKAKAADPEVCFLAGLCQRWPVDAADAAGGQGAL